MLSQEERYAVWLWFLLALFCLRVLGQLLVALFDLSFLPSMEEWYSGLVPYGPLLVAQILIILLYGKSASISLGAMGISSSLDAVWG